MIKALSGFCHCQNLSVPVPATSARWSWCCDKGAVRLLPQPESQPACTRSHSSVGHSQAAQRWGTTLPWRRCPATCPYVGARCHSSVRWLCCCDKGIVWLVPQPGSQPACTCKHSSVHWVCYCDKAAVRLLPQPGSQPACTCKHSAVCCVCCCDKGAVSHLELQGSQPACTCCHSSFTVTIHCTDCLHKKARGNTIFLRPHTSARIST